MRRARLSVSSNSGSPPVSLISWSRSSIAPSSRISTRVRSPAAACGSAGGSDSAVTGRLLSCAGVRPSTSERPAPRPSDFESAADRLAVPTRSLDFRLAVPWPVCPRSLRTLWIRLGLIVPSCPPCRQAAAIVSVPASGWSTRYSFRNSDFPLFFPFTVAMRLAPLWKSRLHTHSVTDRKRDCALSGHDRDAAVRTTRTEYNRDRPVVIVSSSRSWGGRFEALIYTVVMVDLRGGDRRS